MLCLKKAIFFNKSSVKAFSQQKWCGKAKWIAFGSFAFSKFPLFSCQINWFGVNSWKGIHYFDSKSWFHWMLMEIFVWFEQALNVATFTFSLYGMQPRRNLNSHWSGCFMRELHTITVKQNKHQLLFQAEVWLKQDSDL